MIDSGWQYFGQPQAGRKCGSCHFCCVTVPVEAPLHKPGGVRCVHLRARGCGVYQHRPQVCWAWSCVWLFQAEALGLRRPDIAGYCVDPMLQMIKVNGTEVPTIQVWCDRDRPDAHRVPELRQYLALMAEKYGACGLVRWPNGKPQAGQNALALFAPILTGDDWVEIERPMTR